MKNKTIIYMKKLILTITMLFAVIYLTAQANYIDVVHLKNGSIIKGIIIEQRPNVSVKIKNFEGNTFFFNMDDIELIKKEASEQMPEIKQNTSNTSAVNKNDISEKTIIIAENVFKIPALEEKEFYYAFAKGDKVIFNFEETNGKDLKEIEIIEYPSSSKFMDHKKSIVYNKQLTVSTNGIYKFRFSNSALAGRTCKMSIKRIPASEDKIHFDTNVYWKNVNDTTYRTVKNKYLIHEEYKPVSVRSETKLLSKQKDGNSRGAIQIILPKNTYEWVYSVSTYPDESDNKKTNMPYGLFGALSRLIDISGSLDVAINTLAPPTGTNICDVYLLDYENRNLFMSNNPLFKHYSVGSLENSNSGTVRIKGNLNLDGIYLGLNNRSTTVNTFVSVEVVAIVLEQEWEYRDEIEMNVSTYKVPYMSENN